MRRNYAHRTDDASVQMENDFDTSPAPAGSVALSRVTLQALLRGYARLGRRPGLGRERGRRWLRMMGALLKADEGALLLAHPDAPAARWTTIAAISPDDTSAKAGEEPFDRELEEELQRLFEPPRSDDQAAPVPPGATDAGRPPADAPVPTRRRRKLHTRRVYWPVSPLAEAIAPAIDHLMHRRPLDEHDAWDLTTLVAEPGWPEAEAVRRNLDLLRRRPPLVSIAPAPWATSVLSSQSEDAAGAALSNFATPPKSGAGGSQSAAPMTGPPGPVTIVLLARGTSDPPPPSQSADLLHACHMSAAALLFPPLPEEHERLIHLSPNERSTLRKLLSGKSEKQVALELSRSRHTIHSHIKRIYQHMGVATRAELLARFMSV